MSQLALLSFAGINHRCPLPPFIAIPSRLPPASRHFSVIRFASAPNNL
jgi:hypothetical protein